MSVEHANITGLRRALWDQGENQPWPGPYFFKVYFIVVGTLHIWSTHLTDFKVYNMAWLIISSVVQQTSGSCSSCVAEISWSLIRNSPCPHPPAPSEQHSYLSNLMSLTSLHTSYERNRAVFVLWLSCVLSLSEMSSVSSMLFHNAGFPSFKMFIYLSFGLEVCGILFPRAGIESAHPALAA